MRSGRTYLGQGRCELGKAQPLFLGSHHGEVAERGPQFTCCWIKLSAGLRGTFSAPRELVNYPWPIWSCLDPGS